MDKKTQGVLLIIGGVAIAAAIAHNVLKSTEDGLPRVYEGKKAYANRDGVFVYDANQKPLYSKKANEWIATSYAEFNKDFYVGKNTGGITILFKKSDVKTL